MLRLIVPIPTVLGLTEKAFAACVVSYFMQAIGVLQLPEFLGPQWSPFEFNIGMLTTIKSPEQLGIGQTAPDTDDEVATEHVASVAKKKKGQKKKGSKLKSS